MKFLLVNKKHHLVFCARQTLPTKKGTDFKSYIDYHATAWLFDTLEDALWEKDRLIKKFGSARFMYLDAVSQEDLCTITHQK